MESDTYKQSEEWECPNCKSKNIVCNLVHTNLESGNSLYVDRKFGKIDIWIQVCWCCECGTPYNTGIIGLSTKQVE